MTIDLRGYFEELIRFTSRIGIPSDNLQKTETPTRIRYTNTSLSAQPLRALDDAAIQKLRSVFGNAVSLRVSLGDLPLIRLQGDSLSGGVDKLRKQTDDTTNVNFAFEIDKSLLLEASAIRSDELRHFSLFFFAKTLEELLEKGLSDPQALEQALWPEGPRQAVVLIADTSILVTGTLLLIFGHSEVATLDAFAAVDEAIVQDEIRIHSKCREAIRWEQQWSEVLTPRYFQFTADHDSQEQRITKLCSANGANMTLLFTADRIRPAGDGFVASFVAANSGCQIRSLSPDDVIDADISSSTHLAIKLASWIYDQRWQTDRLALYQVAVTRILQRRDRPYSCNGLLDVIDRVDHEVRWHWKTFISAAVERYVQEETELENEIAETVNGYETQVSAMIASLSGTVLAAVGVLIGSFIAAAFETKFNTTIFATGIIGYLLYLLIFPGIYNMTHHRIRYHTMNKIFAKRERRFAHILGAEITKSVIEDDIFQAQSRFENWFKWTVIALSVVFVSVAVAGVVVPIMAAH